MTFGSARRVVVWMASAVLDRVTFLDRVTYLGGSDDAHRGLRRRRQLGERTQGPYVF